MHVNAQRKIWSDTPQTEKNGFIWEEEGSDWDWGRSPEDTLTIICNAFIFHEDIVYLCITVQS